MLLMNLQIKLHNSLVMSVSDIQFSLYSVNFIVIFKMVVTISQIYCGGILVLVHPVDED